MTVRVSPPRDVATVVAGTASIGLALLVVAQPREMLLIACVLSPVALHAGRLIVRQEALTTFNAGSVVVATYAFLVPLRLLTMWMDGWQRVLILGRVTPEQALRTAALLGLMTLALLVAYYCAAGRAGTESRGPRPEEERALQRLAMVCLLASAAGILLVLAANGGPAGVYQKFATHNKGLSLSGIERVGYAAFHLLLPIGVWATVALGRVKSARALRVCAALLVAILVLMLASRLLLLALAVGAWPLWRSANRRRGLVVVLVLAPLVALAGVGIVERRTDRSAEDPVAHRLLRSASYSVLDAAMAVQQAPESLTPRVLNPERVSAGAASLVPTALWPQKPNISTLRLDYAVADVYGNANQRRTTGFPASMLVEGYTAAGWPGALAAGALLGALLGLAERMLVRQAGRTFFARLGLSIIASTAFTYVKDGDAVAALLAMLKVSGYAALLLFAVGAWRAAPDTSSGSGDVR